MHTAKSNEELIGFMQGRLSPIASGKIQVFPWMHWRDEFPLAEQHGFSLMEWTIEQERLYQNPLMTVEGRREIRQLCDRHQVQILSLTGDCFMQAPFWKADPNPSKSLLKDMAAVLVAAADCGIREIVVPLVDNGRLEDRLQTQLLYEGLAEISPLLHQYHLRIVFESDFAPEPLRAFLLPLDPTCFGVNYDMGNSAALGYDAAVEIATYGDRIFNVHVKDRILGGTTVPLGEGNADLAKIFQLLHQSNYRGHYILQTARADDQDHAAALCRYRAQVQGWLQRAKLPGPASGTDRLTEAGLN